MVSRRLIALMGIVMLAASAGFCLAAPPAEKKPLDQKRWEKAWQAEMEGDASTRKHLLTTLMQDFPEAPEARWPLGQIECDGVWIDYTEFPKDWAADKAILEYRRIRGRYPKTYRDQLTLANWCQEHRLADREQAHLTAALELSDNPNEPALRSRLGQRFINGTWLTQAELRHQEQSHVEAQKNFKQWLPRIQKLAKQLDSRQDAVARQAKQDLKAISDREALPALEGVLGGADLEPARLLVEILGSFPSHQAADSLARLAVFSPWKAVREEAIEQLRTRDFGAYVPELLATLQTPVSAKIGLFVGSGGVQLLETFSNETQTTRNVVEKQSTQFTVPTPIGRGRYMFSSSPERNIAFNRDRMASARANAVLGARLLGQQSELAVNLQNEQTKEWNEKICGVLSESTGIQLPPDPDDWWRWWCDYNQVTEADKEQQYVRYNQSSLEVVLQSGIYTPCSCLVAGTPIWTDRGAVAVETIQVGDLVLSKDAETGELAYQPVLRTTIRDAEPLLKVTTPKGSLRATGGHTFWISGQGWTKIRDLKPGQQFHAATGPVEILGLKEDGKEKTYNMIVANVHTYFTGPELILSHDVTIAEPADAVIPGYIKP